MKKDADKDDNGNGDNNKVEIIIVLDKVRYSNLAIICKKYNEQQGTDITPKEYKLMLIDSAISA